MCMRKMFKFLMHFKRYQHFKLWQYVLSIKTNCRVIISKVFALFFLLCLERFCRSILLALLVPVLEHHLQKGVLVAPDAPEDALSDLALLIDLGDGDHVRVFVAQKCPLQFDSAHLVLRQIVGDEEQNGPVGEHCIQGHVPELVEHVADAPHVLVFLSAETHLHASGEEQGAQGELEVIDREPRLGKESLSHLVVGVAVQTAVEESLVDRAPFFQIICYFVEV